MLISETFNGRKLEVMPAIIFATAHSFLLLLGNSHVLSDTSSTSIVWKIKNNTRYCHFGYTMFVKRRKWRLLSLSLSLPLAWVSNLSPIVNHHRENFLFILFIYCLKYSVSQKEIFYCSPKIHCKAYDFFIKLTALKSVSFCHWHHLYTSELLSLYLFYCSTTKLFVSIVTYVWLHYSSQLHFLEISSLIYCTGLCISCLDELSFHSLLVCWWL